MKKQGGYISGFRVSILDVC